MSNLRIEAENVIEQIRNGSGDYIAVADDFIGELLDIIESYREDDPDYTEEDESAFDVGNRVYLTFDGVLHYGTVSRIIEPGVYDVETGTDHFGYVEEAVLTPR